MSQEIQQIPIAPIRLAANQPRQFYRGGQAIAQLRGELAVTDFGPEDWVGSTTTRFGHDQSGLSVLPDGSLLRDAVRQNPVAWLGPDHVAQFGSNTGLLVKLLDAGQRLPVHCHPSNDFAKTHLHSSYGKTEAWIVIGTTGNNPLVYLGFQNDLDEGTLDDWVSQQNSTALLGALNPLGVRQGDTIFVPAGLPHAIGEGVFIVELQQPTDFSITLEWQGFLDDAQAWHLGLGQPTALTAVDRSGWPEAGLSSLITHAGTDPHQDTELLRDQAAPFFRAERLHITTPTVVDAGFSILIILEGNGTLRTEHGVEVPVSKGNTLVTPYSAGSSIANGELTMIRCRPPLPSSRPASRGGQA